VAAEDIHITVEKTDSEFENLGIEFFDEEVTTI